MRQFLLATLIGIAGITTASAQTTVDGRCVKMKDPVSCTCALIHGGSATNGSWAKAPGADPTVFNTCVAERGGKGPNRPTTIPGRL